MAKFDEEKPRLGLVYRSMLEEIAKVRAYGVKKYGDREDWRLTENKRERYFDAALRHLNQAKEAEIDYKKEIQQYDDESLLLHLSHAACCIMFLIEDLKIEDKIRVNEYKGVVS